MQYKQAKNIGRMERVLSVVGGGMLLRRTMSHPLQYPFRFIGGAYLLYRGITGRCRLYQAFGRTGNDNPAVNIKTFFTINKPRAEVYGYWRDLGNLPLFMTHIEQVEQLDERRSRWTAALGPHGGKISWNAEIVKDEPGYFIGWRSVPDSVIENAGKVEFVDAPDGSTEVKVNFSYHPPAGGIGAGIAKLLNPLLKGMIEEEIRHFKQVMEAGEMPTTNGQPSGPRTGKIKLV